MAEFDDLYSETETKATFWVGRGKPERVGQIVASSRHEGDQDSVIYYGSFSYDGETGALTIGDLQLGLPGKIILGRVSDTSQGVLLDGLGGKLTLGARTAGNGTLSIVDRFGTVVGKLSAEDARLTLGAGPSPGSIVVQSFEEDQHGTKVPWTSFFYDGATVTLVVGDAQLGDAGQVIIGAGSGGQGILLEGNGSVTLGAQNLGNGSLTVKNRFGTTAGVLDAETATLSLRSAGGDDTVVLDGKNGNITLGGGGDADGDLTVRSAGGNTAITLSGSDAAITLGGAGGMNGDLVVKNGDDVETIVLKGSDGTLTLGGEGVNGDIFVKNDNDIETIKIFGSIGDIEFLNADLAEEFEVERTGLDLAAPGTVMVLNDHGTLAPCSAAYDGRVVGVVAGAGDHRPGIVMDKSGGANRVPIALVGKAFCLADASAAPIAVGDLLTTSARTGHAMKAGDRLMAVGSVIGKALALPAACGLIPMLVMTR